MPFRTLTVRLSLTSTESSPRSITLAMSSRSLEQLQQHIAQQEAALERLRQPLVGRQQQLDSLQRRKQELQEQLRQVDAQLAAVAGTKAAPTETPKSPARPKGPTGRSSRNRSQPPLRELIVTALRESGRPLTGKQLAEEALRRGFVTTSANFVNFATKRVHQLYKQGILKR